MAGYAGVYVLARERSASLLRHFLDKYAPSRELSAEEIMVCDASREVCFVSCEAAIEYCASLPFTSTALYWRNLSPSPAHLMAFFLADGHLLLGFSTSEQESCAQLARLLQFCGPTSCGYVTFEEPPPDEIAAFHARCNDRSD